MRTAAYTNTSIGRVHGFLMYHRCIAKLLRNNTQRDALPRPPVISPFLLNLLLFIFLSYATSSYE